jgi:hypothetical protein
MCDETEGRVMGDENARERTPLAGEAGGAVAKGDLTSSGTNGSEVPPIVERLTAINNTSSQELARLALGGAVPDEIVPTAEGITFFEGKRARDHKKSGSKRSLLAERLDRISKTPELGSDRPTDPSSGA